MRVVVPSATVRSAIVRSAVVVGLVAVLLAPLATAKKEEPAECVRLARTWEQAVEEARILNCPIVVHSHGFFCGPCWGMYASLMCNEDYIAFAARNTVEVLTLDRLQEGIDKEDARAETFETTVEGQPARCFVKFPDLRAEDLLALNRSKAGSYNDTGAVPFTCVVDPHTLEEMARWQGTTPRDEIVAGVEAAGKTLAEKNGEGFRRKDWSRIVEAEDDAWARVAKGDWAKAIAAVEKASAKAAQWPEAVRAHVEATRAAIVARAAKVLDDLEALAATDAAAAKKELAKVRSKLKGTGLEERAAALYATL